MDHRFCGGGKLPSISTLASSGRKGLRGWCSTGASGVGSVGDASFVGRLVAVVPLFVEHESGIDVDVVDIVAQRIFVFGVVVGMRDDRGACEVVAVVPHQAHT